MRAPSEAALRHGPGALSWVTVLDLSDSVAGQFCGRLLADNGATVLLGEPAEGAATRRAGPFASVAGRPLESCLFWHLNLGKRSVLADLQSAAGQAELRGRARSVDVVIVDSAAALHVFLTDEQQGPALCCITPFGRAGDWRDWQASEIIFQALSGTMFENGSPDREPLFGVGHRASYAAGVIAYVQCLAALLAGERRRDLIDVSIAEVAACMNFNRATQYSYNGEIEDRGARTTPRAITRCADGWVTVFIYDHRWRQSCAALGLEDLVDDPRFVNEEARLRNWDAFTGALETHLRGRRVEEVVAAGQREKAVVARAIAPSELRTDRQLLARGYWDWSVAHPDRLPRLGPMFRFSDTPQVDRGGAPALHGTAGIDGAALPAQRWTPDTAQPGPSTQQGLRMNARPRKRRRPLEGVTILDLTTAWSGPMATRILAALGAEVLKIEGPGRIDDWRGPLGGGLPSRYPDRLPGERPYNRCFQFNTQNHDKIGLALDLKTAAGRDIALRLAGQCDVMIANFSAGTLDRMGLGWSVVSMLNPRLVLLEMPAYGVGGPITDYVALGPSMEFMSGMARLIGYGDGRPVTTGPAYLDPIGGFNAAAAILTALVARQGTHLGQHVEVAQREAAMHWIGEEIISAVATGQDRSPRGNRVPGIAPHDAFPCAGRDEWVVIAAPGDREFQALCRIAGLPELAADPAYSTSAARQEHEDALYGRLAVWTRSRDKHEIAAALQLAGVQAAPVCNARDLSESAFLRYRGLLQTVTHPEAGTHLYQGLPLHMQGYDLAIAAPAPCFGQDTEPVLRAKLGLGDAKIRALRSGGVIADQPRGEVG